MWSWMQLFVWQIKSALNSATQIEAKKKNYWMFSKMAFILKNLLHTHTHTHTHTRHLDTLSIYRLISRDILALSSLELVCALHL